MSFDVCCRSCIFVLFEGWEGVFRVRGVRERRVGRGERRALWVSFIEVGVVGVGGEL